MNAPSVLGFFGLPMRRGADVTRVQAALAALNLLPREGVDGLFGPQTARAVKAFQIRARLNPTGTVDAVTLTRLQQGAVAPAPVQGGAAPVSGPPLSGPANPADLPDARAQRVVMHWTAGGARASALDRQHYHFMVEQDGTVVRGRFSIADNDNTSDGRYAAHTRGFNTGSVGVALCGMANARERPFFPGSSPITREQVQVLARLVAQICRRYGIPVTRQTVLAHGEVERFCNRPQAGKWDPLVLPWDRSLGTLAVGDSLRQMVGEALRPTQPTAPPVALPDPEIQPFPLTVLGQVIPGGGFSSNGEDWAPVQPLIATLGWGRTDTAPGRDIELLVDGREIAVPLRPDDPNIVLDLSELAEALDLVLAVDPGDGRRIERPSVSVAGFRPVVVRRGDGAIAIARRELGDPSRWTELRLPDGTALDQLRAAALRVGEVLLAPDGPPEPSDDDLPERIAQAVAPHVDAGLAPEAARAVPLIVRALFEHGIRDPAQIAYVLATAQHETNLGRSMIEKWGPSAQQLKYERMSLNLRPGDGKRYLGRGYVQLTGRLNYRSFGGQLRLPLEDDPDLAAHPEHAARILVLGMAKVGFRGANRVLGKYAGSGGYDFYRARSIINADRDLFSNRYGTTIGEGIARRAVRFHNAIKPLFDTV